jgi:hypothetical protein
MATSLPALAMNVGITKTKTSSVEVVPVFVDAVRLYVVVIVGFTFIVAVELPLLQEYFPPLPAPEADRIAVSPRQNLCRNLQKL